MIDRRALGLAGLFVVGAVVWQSTFPHLLGIDGFFHLAQTRRILEDGLNADMPWMRYGIFEHGWVDHHLGFHVALLPFVAWPGGVLGGKLAAGVLGGGAVAAIFVWLRAFKVPHAAWLALVPVAASWAFVFRLGMVRAVSLSTILLTLTLWAAIRGRVKTLFVVSLIYAFSYHLSVLVIPIALGAWLFARVLGDNEDRPPALVPAVAVAGFVLGFSVHPHFPRTWSFFLRHVVVGLDLAGVPHGAEWSSATLGDVWMQGFVWCATFVVGAVWVVRTRGPVRWETALLTAGAVVAIVLSVESVRFVELSMPLVTLATGLLLRDGAVDLGRAKPLLAGVVAVGVVLTCGRATRNGDLDPHRYEDAGEWMWANVEQGELVYNFRWGDWSELTFHAPEQQYVFGLEPAFLAAEHPDKWRHFWAIRRGEYGNVGAAVKAEFGASWVFTGLPEPGVLELFDQDGGLQRAVVTSDFAIYRVVAH